MGYGRAPEPKGEVMSDSTASGVSRRTFIGGAAAGVAVVTASAVPMLNASATPAPDDDTVELAKPVVARVRDLKTGEVTLYVGTEEVTISDRTLARRLARAAAR